MVYTIIKGSRVNKKVKNWLYFGYTDETLKEFDSAVAIDNLKLLKQMNVVILVVLGVMLVNLILFYCLETYSRRILIKHISVVSISAFICLAIGLYQRYIKPITTLENFSRVLTTLFMSTIMICMIVLETFLKPTTIVSLFCGIIIFSQCCFDSRPNDNLLFISIGYVLFIMCSFLSKDFELFIIDMATTFCCGFIGILLSWHKSKNKYEVLMSAETERIVLKEKMETEIKEGKMSLMISQIKPHFIYNTLTAISVLCDKEPKLAKKATIEFSEYLRGNLDAFSINVPVPFTQELSHVKNYLNLEKMRFDDDLTIDYDITTENFSLPSLTLQPIVENAVKHGVGKKIDGGTILISTGENETTYFVIVKDTGVGFDVDSKKSDERQHIGIENVKNRLHLISNANLSIQSEIGLGTIATITIPKGL